MCSYKDLKAEPPRVFPDVDRKTRGRTDAELAWPCGWLVGRSFERDRRVHYGEFKIITFGTEVPAFPSLAYRLQDVSRHRDQTVPVLSDFKPAYLSTPRCYTTTFMTFDACPHNLIPPWLSQGFVERAHNVYTRVSLRLWPACREIPSDLRESWASL